MLWFKVAILVAGTKSDRWVPPPGYSGFLPHEDHRNADIAANEQD